MYLMFTDETNTRPSPDVKFFIYGGLLLPIEKIVTLDAEIESIRVRAGYTPEQEFKFDTRSRPSQVTRAAFTQAKNEVIDSCFSQGVKLIVHIILHDIIKNQDPEKHVQWAADYVIGKFNQFLGGKANDYGMCVVDNLPRNYQFRYLTDKFVLGLKFNKKAAIKLDRIKLFAASCINASHLSSATDIVLGSFRYCINNPKNSDAAKQMMGKVVELLWGEKDDKSYRVVGAGLIVRPPIDQISVLKYKSEYEALFKHINGLLAS